VLPRDHRRHLFSPHPWHDAGAVFVNANATNNQVWMYGRARNGNLSLVGSFSTQGLGGIVV